MKDRERIEALVLANESRRLAVNMNLMSIEDFKQMAQELTDKLKLLKENPEQYFEKYNPNTGGK